MTQWFVSFGVSICGLGFGGRRDGVLAFVLWSGLVPVAPVKGAFWWCSRGDPQCVVVHI